MNLRILFFLMCLHTGVFAQVENSWKSDSAYSQGQFFYKNGAYDQALKSYFLSLKKFQAKKDVVATGNVKNAIGLVYIRVGNEQMAQKYLTEALEISLSQKNVTGISNAYNNLGILAQNGGDCDLATKHYQNSLKFKRANNDSIGISRSLCNLGTVEIEKKNYRGALDYYFQSLEMKLAVKDSSGLAVIYANIGDAYGNLGVLDSTRLYLLRGMEIAVKLNELPAMVQYYRNLSALYEELHDPGTALSYERLYNDANDRLFNSALAEELARQEIKFQVSAKQKELEISESKNAFLEKEKEVKLRNSQVLWGFLIALTIGIFLLVLLLKFRSRTIVQQKEANERERALAELSLKNEQNQKKQLLHEKEMVDRELLLISMQTLKKQEMLSNLYQDVLNEREKSPKIDSEILDTALKQLKANLNAEDDWENFKLYFEKVHPTFFLTISDRFPELTQTDHRHMAYILIGLSTKEIARLMSITPESVQKSRVRLKKKLGLPKEDGLIDFIKNI